MNQTVEIKRLLDHGRCEVWIRRETSCGGSCGTCGGCGEVGASIAAAKNTACALPGDIAEVTARPARLLGGAAFVYLLPVTFAIIATIALSGFGQTIAAMGFIFGFAVGAALVFAYGKLRRKGEYLEVVRVLERCGNCE